MAAKWHERYTPAKRIQPTKRSENLYYGPNLLQIQSKSVTPEHHDSYIESIGVSLSNIIEVIANWKSAGGFIGTCMQRTAQVQDPWGVTFEFVERSPFGYSHINIASVEPEKLRDWYESNLGGRRMACEWDSTRLIVEYDTMMVVFIPMTSPVSSTIERPIDHLGWYTDDLDASFNRLSANGVKFPVEPREFGQVRLAFAEDPGGNWIELLEPPKGIIKKPI